MSIEFDFPLAFRITRNVAAALVEDIGAGDLTADLVPGERSVRATVISREDGVLCGRDWFDRCVLELDPQAEITWQPPMASASPPTSCCAKSAPTPAPCSRPSAAPLNFLQLLSAVASKARIYADAIAGTKAQVVDTRKTLPGLRIAQKYAVRAGGGGNHRLALWDAILIKENHIHAAGGIAEAMAAAKNAAAAAVDRCKFIQIEVESLAELETALGCGATMILLDNFSLDMLRDAVKLNAGRAVLESSGNVTLEPYAASPKPAWTASRSVP